MVSVPVLRRAVSRGQRPDQPEAGVGFGEGLSERGTPRKLRRRGGEKAPGEILEERDVRHVGGYAAAALHPPAGAKESAAVLAARPRKTEEPAGKGANSVDRAVPRALGEVEEAGRGGKGQSGLEAGRKEGGAMQEGSQGDGLEQRDVRKGAQAADPAPVSTAKTPPRKLRYSGVCGGVEGEERPVVSVWRIVFHSFPHSPPMSGAVKRECIQWSRGDCQEGFLPVAGGPQ